MFQAECNLSPSVTSMLLSIDHHLQTGRPMTDTPIAATVAAIEAFPGSPVRVPILAEMAAIDVELAARAVVTG
jgi:hypothetical protein